MSRFPLPTMPFNRDVVIAIGTQIRLTAKPYPDAKKLVNFKLNNRNNDTGLNIQIDLENNKISINSTISGQTSSSLEYISQIPFERSFVLLVTTLQHSFQITLNNTKLSDFVHRVDPTTLSTISITGPLICEEVDISSTLPSYEQVTTQMMSNMSLGDTTKPSAPPGDLPPPPPSVLNPTSASSSFFYAGNSQGFSNHPYPLPGLIDNTTPASQQLPTQPLPSSTSATTVPVSPASSITVTSPPYPTGQPYTVQFPSQTSTPQYQNSPSAPQQPYLPPVTVPQTTVPPPQAYFPQPPVTVSQATVPPPPQQYLPQLPVTVPQATVPPAQQYLPPLPVTVPPPPQAYLPQLPVAVPQATVLPSQPYYYPPQTYGYPYGGVYYTPEYYPHHHHHHGHHHHHCD